MAQPAPSPLSFLRVDATDRALAAQETERQNAFLAALHDTALDIAGRLDVTELLEAVVKRALGLVESLYGWVYLVAEGGQTIEVKVATGLFRQYIGLSLGKGEGLAGAIWQGGCPISVDDYHAWSWRAAPFEGDPVGPAMGVPLKAEGQVVGVIGLTRARGRAPFAPDEVEVMSRFAQLASIALENARLHTSLQAQYETLERRVQERTHELAALNAIAAAVSRSLDLESILCDALDKTLEATGMEMGLACKLATRADSGAAGADEPVHLIPLVHRGISQALAAVANPMPLSATHLKLPPDPEPIVWEVARHPNPAYREALGREGVVLGISVPVISKGVLLGALFIATGRMRTVIPEELSLLKAVGNQVAVALENAQLYQAALEREAEAERRRQVAEGMREILAVLNSRQSLPEVLNAIVTQACRLLGCEAAILFRLEPDNLLRAQASCGLDLEYVSSLALPFGLGGAGRAVAEQRAVALPDAVGYMDYVEREGAPPPGFPPERASLDRLIRRGVHALLSVPLVIRGESYGAITLYYQTARDFAEEEMRLALSMAHQAALAIDSARLRERAAEVAAIAERARLARELHDSVTQSLYSMTLYAEAAARLLTTGEQLQAADYLRDLRDTSQEALREMRLLVFELRPPALEQVGLAGAIEARLKTVETRGGMATELCVDGTAPPAWLSLADQQELYTIAQEALNNAFKHAHARRVSVHLQYGEQAVSVKIADDGEGFDPLLARESGGMGLTGMLERAENICARLAIDSNPGCGTTVTITVSQRRLGQAHAGQI